MSLTRRGKRGWLAVALNPRRPTMRGVGRLPTRPDAYLRQGRRSARASAAVISASPIGMPDGNGKPNCSNPRLPHGLGSSRGSTRKGLAPSANKACGAAPEVRIAYCFPVHSTSLRIDCVSAPTTLRTSCASDRFAIKRASGVSTTTTFSSPTSAITRFGLRPDQAIATSLYGRDQRGR